MRFRTLIARALPALLLLQFVSAAIAQLPVELTPATQPTTQQASAQPVSAIDQFSSTGFGRIMTGKQSLTVQDILNPNFWVDNIKDLIQTIALFIPRLLGTLLFLFVFWLIYRGIRRMAMGSMKKGEVDSSIREMLGTLIKWCVMGFGIVIACNQLGIPIVAMLTGVSIIGLAVGFAAQETLSNFIAGIVIFLDKPFKVGDWIDIEGTFGQVRRVSFRSTRMLTLDGQVVVFPNTQVLAKQVANHSTNPITRVHVAVGIAYKESIDAARKVLLTLVEKDERVEKNPPPEVVVDSLGDSSVNLHLRFWLADEEVEKTIVFEYNEKAKLALDEAKIEIPFPHLQMFVEKSEGVETLARAMGNGSTATKVA